MSLFWDPALIRLGLAVGLIFCATQMSQAQTLAGRGLVDQLRQGGYVFVMRHANSPAVRPDRSSADPENTNLERQLDDAGKATARAMGDAIRALRIPVGMVLSSPTYRARQSVHFASLGAPEIRQELDEGAQNMQAAAGVGPSAWLRNQSAISPARGTNTIIVTHSPNILGAFAQAGANIASGESLIVKPDGNGGSAVVARVKIEEWESLKQSVGVP
jgi:phosphohistidine phosphatase SixA